MVAAMNVQLRGVAGFKEIWTPHKRFHLGFIEFTDPQSCRNFLQAKLPLSYQGKALWCSLARTPGEAMECRPFSSRLRAVRETVDELRLKCVVDFDFGLQCIWLNGERALECVDRRLHWRPACLQRWGMEVEALEGLASAPRT